MKVLIKNQSDKSNPHFLLFNPTIHFTFRTTLHLSAFLIFFLFLSYPKRFLPQGQSQDDTRGPPAENDRQPDSALGRLVDLPEAPSGS